MEIEESRRTDLGLDQIGKDRYTQLNISPFATTRNLRKQLVFEIGKNVLEC